jgi:hypothetical protein
MAEAWRKGLDKPKKGETASGKKARQQEFYKRQREHAEETGDQKTTDKIYSKMGKKSHSVDSDKVNKAALGGVAAVMGTRGLGRIAGAGRAAKAARAAGGAKTGQKSLGEGVQHLGKARPVAQKALGSGRSSLGGKSQKALRGNVKYSTRQEPKYEKGSGGSGKVNKYSTRDTHKPIYNEPESPTKTKGK